MKTLVKYFVVGAMVVSGTSVANAQNPKDDIVCRNENTVLENNSLYFEYAKQKAWKDAYEFWRPIYDTVPDYNKNLYIQGEKILINMINASIREKNVEARKDYLEQLMALYDNRIKYFGNDTKTPAAKILGTKAHYYLGFYKNTANLDSAYNWLTQSVNTLKDDADAKALVEWISVSQKKFAADASFKNEYIDNYMKGSQYIDGSLDNWYKRLDSDREKLAASPTDEKLVKDTTTCLSFINFIKTEKVNLTDNFAKSGAADVETLVAVFTPQVEEKKEDAQFLNNVTKLLGRSKAGKETDLYFQVSEYSYALAPTFASAKGMAQLSIKNQDWDNAIKYLEEALTFAFQPEDKSDIILLEANVYYKYKKSFAKARDLCRQSISLDRTSADPYIFIADMYRQSGEMVFPDGDNIVRSTCYMAAVEELQKGKTADPSRAAEINSMIQNYKKAFPERSQLFMKGMQAGTKYHIPGWMNIDITIPD
ncbi:MAG: hypothetical protein IJS20_05655 [Bacteroidales bacterium]|nr:hypothetical protein [Bacteroidales bacterium]